MTEALVETITREVLKRLQESGALAPAASAGRAPAPPVRTSTRVLARDERTASRQAGQRSPEAVRSAVAAGASRFSASPGANAIPRDIAATIDHTLLKPEATEQEVRELCREARDFSFASVCVNPSWVPLCAELLRGCDVKVCTVIGFPLGANAPSTKAFEARKAIREGAREVDMVVNIGALKAKNYDLVEEDVRAVVEAARESGSLVKVIIETALLTDEEKVAACFISKEAGADFVKTSTGFSSGGATLHDVALMRATVGPDMGVKASGGVRNYAQAVGMLEAGATRLGASAGVQITRESRGEKVAASSKEKY